MYAHSTQLLTGLEHIDLWPASGRSQADVVYFRFL